jgi:DNA-directed RNA polymerase specialized sigma24 family protein
VALRSGKNTDTYLPARAGERVRPVSVVRAFQALPSAHREILNETVFRERSVNEAAVSLGIPVDVVKTRVYHALRALRVALDTPEPGRYGTG